MDGFPPAPRQGGPVLSVLPGRCVVEKEKTVRSADLYAAWCRWCEDHGHEPGSDANFGVKLRAVIFNLGQHRPREGGKQIKQYMGVGLA